MPRPSLFTFSSALHSSSVLQALNELRLGEVLCDVTVTTIEGRSFRAHAAVLAACSRYFHGRLQGAARERRSVTLPPEVTAAGFEPLLNFAYTSQLLFSKDNIRAVHHCAELLGFHDLETSCFDFLLPKFSEDRRPSQRPPPPMACCQKPLPGSRTDQRAASETLSLASPTDRRAASETLSSASPTDRRAVSETLSSASPTNRQAASETLTQQPETTVSKTLTLETCGPQMTPLTLDAAASGVCPMLRCGDSGETDEADEADGVTRNPDGDEGNLGGQSELQDPRLSGRSQTSGVQQEDLRLSGHLQTSIVRLQDPRLSGHLQTSRVQQEEVTENQQDVTHQPTAGSDETLRDESREQCPFRAETSCDPNAAGDLLQTTISVLNPDEGFADHDDGIMDTSEGFTDRTEGFTDRTEAFTDRIEEFTDRTEGFTDTNEGFADRTEGFTDASEGFADRSSVEREVAEHLAKGFWSELCPEPERLPKAEDFHWQLDLSSGVGECPFLRDMGTAEDEPETICCLSPCPSSSVQSGTDSETDPDAEANQRRAAEMQLPFPVEQISALSRSAFQQVLKRKHLTSEQQEFVQDVRRRSKNRMAAQRCRKRKLDDIQQLESDISVLRMERERLLQERTELQLSLEQTRQDLCGLGLDSGLDSETSPDHTKDHCRPISECSSGSDRGLDPSSDLCPSGLSSDPEPSLEQTEEHCPLLDMSPVTPSSSSCPLSASSPLSTSCPLSASLFMDMDSF